MMYLLTNRYNIPLNVTRRFYNQQFVIHFVHYTVHIFTREISANFSDNSWKKSEKRTYMRKVETRSKQSLFYKN